MLDTLKKLEQELEKDLISVNVNTDLASLYLKTIQELQSANGALWRYVIDNNHTLTTLFDRDGEFLNYVYYDLDFNSVIHIKKFNAAWQEGYLGSLLDRISVEDDNLDPTEWFKYIDDRLDYLKLAHPLKSKLPPHYGGIPRYADLITDSRDLYSRTYTAKKFSRASIDDIVDFMIFVDLYRFKRIGVYEPSVRLNFSTYDSKFNRQHVNSELKWAYNKKLIEIKDTEKYRDLLPVARSGGLCYSYKESFSLDDIWRVHFDFNRCQQI